MAAPRGDGVTAGSFAGRHGLWTPDQLAAAEGVAAKVTELGLGVVRLAFVDAHGVLRGKTLVAEALPAPGDGVNATTTLLLKDLAGTTVFPVFSDGGAFPDQPLMRGAADMVMLPDPKTFQVLPWAPHSGWMLCDLFLPDGTPMPLSSRAILARQVDALAARGLVWTAGIEVECHVVRADHSVLNAGYQYLTELRYDELDPLMERLRAALQALGLPLRTLEVEFGPSQIELTFGPADGMAPADQLILVRSCVKQVCRRAGYVASFMSKPRLPRAVASGWHLHQSLRDASGRNLFAADTAHGGLYLSPLARQWLAGLLAHAAGACAMTTPTVNGYRRYRPRTNAPTRACWAADNRGAMMRVLGGAHPHDPATRLENRVGEPAANPYLAMAAQIAAGLDGVDRALDPGAAATAPYECDAPLLPRGLGEALAALRDDACLGAAFGPMFVEYFMRLKTAELDRALDAASVVTEWEHTEYFDLL